MWGKRPCIARITRASTVPSPTPASNTRSAGGRGCRLDSSSATRSAITRFSLQVWTNSRYRWRFSKKRKFALGSRFSGGTTRPRDGATPPGVDAAMKALMRSSVSMVMRLPSRSRCTSLPSLTARRPNVVSAMSKRRQKSEIWLRISSFFIRQGGRAGGWDKGGQEPIARSSYHRFPTKETPAAPRRQLTYSDAIPSKKLNLGANVFGRYCVVALLFVALSGIARAGYLTDNPDEVFETVYARIGALPVQAARDPSVWLRLEELKREPCDQKTIGDLAQLRDKLGYRRQAAEGLYKFVRECGAPLRALNQSVEFPVAVRGATGERINRGPHPPAEEVAGPQHRRGLNPKTGPGDQPADPVNTCQPRRSPCVACS